MRLTLVRHGETEGQSSIRYHGRTDVPLSALGRAQMERVRQALDGEAFVGVYASELSRAVEAATIVGATTHVTRVAGFNEIDFGDWESLTAEEIQARDPERYARWVANRGDFGYPRGESTAALHARVVRALHDVLARTPSGNLLFVVHKGVIRSIVAELLRLDDNQRHGITVALASIHIVRQDNGAWRAEVLDRIDHL
jgi:broad specificity phosphatase PhoE